MPGEGRAGSATIPTSGEKRGGGPRRTAGDAGGAATPPASPLRYAALLDVDGPRVLAEFPDCPGCRIAAEGEQIQDAAQRALEGWLEGCLASGRLPPEPSLAVISRDWFEWIEVPPPLAGRLESRWAEARRTSAPRRVRAKGAAPKARR